MKPEQRFWRNKVQPVFAAMPGVEYERVELRTGRSGMPDVVYTCGYTGWVELKWSTIRPCPMTGIHGTINLDGWDSEQRRWARKHCAAGATVLLLIGTSEGSFLIDAFMAINFDEVHITSPAVKAMWPGKIDPADFKQVLIECGKWRRGRPTNGS